MTRVPIERPFPSSQYSPRIAEWHYDRRLEIWNNASVSSHWAWRTLSEAAIFTKVFGWRRSMEKAEGVVFFQAGGRALALFPREDLAKDACVPSDGQGFSGVSLAHNVRSREEVNVVLAEAEAAGARILKPAEDAPWGGYSRYISDPDGFLWEVAWNPYFPIAADGSIQLPD